MSLSRKRKGALGENLAIAFFKKRSYQILKANYYSPYGEIDLILKKNELIVFVEVKLRTNSNYGHVLEQITNKKQERIIQTADFFLNQYIGFYELCRFDYISFFLERGKKVKSTYIENIFSVNL